jgi:hypothetical protein
MNRWTVALVLLLAAVPALGAAGDVAVTATGWFGCDKCSPARVKADPPGPPGQECARKCIRDGANVMFIDEKRKELFRVDNPDLTKGIESDYVELVGTMNAEAKTVHVDKVTVKSKYVASCGKPKS